MRTCALQKWVAWLHLGRFRIRGTRCEKQREPWYTSFVAKSRDYLLLRLIAAFKLISRRILKLSNALEHRWRNGFMYRFDGGEFPRTLAGEEVQRKSSKSLVCG